MVRSRRAAAARHGQERTALGGIDTITTNHTNGHWQLTFIDSRTAGEETQTEPNSGGLQQVTIPKAGARFTSSALGGRTVIAAPSVPASITGTYDDLGTVSFNNASFPIAGIRCTTSPYRHYQGQLQDRHHQWSWIA